MIILHQAPQRALFPTLCPLCHWVQQSKRFYFPPQIGPNRPQSSIGPSRLYAETRLHMRSRFLASSGASTERVNTLQTELTTILVSTPHG